MTRYRITRSPCEPLFTVTDPSGSVVAVTDDLTVATVAAEAGNSELFRLRVVKLLDTLDAMGVKSKTGDLEKLVAALRRDLGEMG